MTQLLLLNQKPIVSQSKVIEVQSGTGVVPDGVSLMFFCLIGGGGTGGDYSTDEYAAGSGAGGGSGYMRMYTIPVTIGQNYTVVIGAGGAGSANYRTSATAGGNTTLTIGGITYTAKGGNGANQSGGGAGGCGGGGARECSNNGYGKDGVAGGSGSNEGNGNMGDKITTATITPVGENCSYNVRGMLNPFNSALYGGGGGGGSTSLYGTGGTGGAGGTPYGGKGGDAGKAGNNATGIGGGGGGGGGITIDSAAAAVTMQGGNGYRGGAFIMFL